MSAHTHGPWGWKDCGDYCTLVSRIDGEFFPNGDQKYIMVIDDGSAGGEYSPTIDVNGADARLIAAAPDLLEELKELIYITKVLAPTCLGDEGQKENCLDRAIAAVEKAIGKRL